MRVLGGILAVLMAAACGAPSTVADAGHDAGLPPVDAGDPEDAGKPDSGVDAGPVDAGAACDREEPCTIRWDESPGYPTTIDHHTTFAWGSDAGAWLYVVGGVSAGNNGQVTDVYGTVRRAAIRGDGGLGDWEDAGTLPRVRAFHAQAVVDNKVYLLGGISRDDAGVFGTDSVTIGTLADDGSLSFTAGTSIGRAGLHPTAAKVGSRLYFVGGTTNMPLSAVNSAAINSDGTLGPWSAAPSLPTARSHHTSLVYNGKLYLFGGFDGFQEPHESIWRSNLASDGTISGWVPVGDIPSSPWTGSSVLIGNSVLLVGGGEGGPGLEKYVNRVRRIRFYPNETTMNPEESTPLPLERSHVHQTPIWNGRIYSVGGRTQPSLISTNRVFIGTAGAAP